MLSRRKHVMLFMLSVVLFAAQRLPQATAGERLVVVETFVNDDCLGCATLNALLNRLACHHHGDIVLLSYHLWWPDQADPFYLAAGEEATLRRDYYDESITALPMVIIDGEPYPDPDYLHRTDYASWAAAFDSCAALPGEYQIDLAASLSDTLGEVTVTITPRGGTRTLTAYLVIIERHVGFATPPGINGESAFFNVVRRMVPDAGGEELTILQVPVTRGYTFAMESTWDPGQVEAVFFLQDPATRKILGAASSRTRFTLRADTHQQIVSAAGGGAFSATLHNLHSSAQQYLLSWELSAGDGWGVTVQCGGVVREDSSILTLAALAQQDISIEVVPGPAGEAAVSLTVTALSQDSASVTQEFVTVAGVPLLLVDDDGFLEYEDYFRGALDYSGVPCGSWQRGYGKLSPDDLSGVEALVWWTGMSFPTLDHDDRTLLEGFLDGGGNLFLTGQDIGYDLCDTSYAYFDSLSGSREFFESFLSARYLNDISGVTSLQGLGDPISDGISISIDGPGGADNQFYPSIISPLSPALAAFQYEANKVGGIYCEQGSHRVVYFAFGFEAITSDAHRRTILNNILDWFSLATPVRPAADHLIAPTRVAQNYPNPFNALTVIRFAARRSCEASIRVYDVQGREVATLLRGEISAGEHQVTFSADGLPSGIYFCHARIGELRRVFKMSLLR